MFTQREALCGARAYLKGRMSTQKTVRQSADSVEENKLRLEQEKAEQIVDALNTELANSYVLYHQLKKHHWVVEGAEFLPSTSSSRGPTNTSRKVPT